ncbi:MAG: PAS domain-containing protein [Candidatus Omnitrophica bacterium]|nr:PAS domain-containing protein [Candidatus Omnitrophota bacterium]
MKNNANNQQGIFESMIDSVIILNREGRIEEINQAALNLLGYRSKEELLQKPLSSVSENFALEKIMDKIPLPDYEMVYLDREKKKIPVNVNVTARRDTQGEIKDIILVARDIRKIKGVIKKLTESKEELESSYLRLQESKDELVHSEKLAFTGRIAANIAHEIRNPLTNVAISVEQLKKATEPDDPRTEDIDIIKRNVERADYLITELLNCARPPKLNVRLTDANRLLNRALKNTLESTMTKNKSQKIEVVKKFSSKPPIIRMDKEQMERAFSNLILNAIEAMPKRGKLTIITGFDENFFVVKIQDTGKGISEEDIITIYDPFFSTKPGGVGLGLTLCYGIIVSHGGTIEVESKLRKGTIFTVSLPVGRH